ncbi:MAG: sterol desaturase family protein [Saprospiraceae bacterium]|nr:sterol desaturase family protein [Saprospiraceae bacterium]
MKPNNTNNAQGQIFSSKYLEVLSRANPKVSALIYTLVIVFFLVVGYRLNVTEHFTNALIIFLFAMFFWTFFEYLAHRYFFHLDHYFPKSKVAERVAYIFHGIHHDYPRDVSRLIMPPAPGLLIIAVLFAIGWFIMGTLTYLFLPGFLTGYLLYTYVHYKSHVTPVPGYLKYQYRHHALHHYKDQDQAFGVSSPFWDWVFGTMPKIGKEE